MKTQMLRIFTSCTTIAGAALLLAGCVSSTLQSQTSNIEAGSIQPRSASYNCGDNGAITLENTRTMVRLTEADGNSYDLPAAPPAQLSRYGEGLYALVLEGREALWMKSGKEPMTCKR